MAPTLLAASLLICGSLAWNITNKSAVEGMAASVQQVEAESAALEGTAAALQKELVEAGKVGEGQPLTAVQEERLKGSIDDAVAALGGLRGVLPICATRSDCGAGQVCAGAEDPWKRVIQHPTGFCQMCSKFNATACPWPCASRAGECSDRSLEMLTDLDLKPPYYFQLLSCITKPVVTILVFGLDNPFQRKAVQPPLWKQMAAPVAFEGMFLAAARKDLETLWRVCLADIAWWEKLLLAGAVLLTSSTVASAVSGLALILSAEATRVWVREHDPERNEPEDHRDVWKRTYVGVTGVYAVLLFWLATLFSIVAACVRPVSLLCAPFYVAHLSIQGFIMLGLGTALLASLFGVGRWKCLARGGQHQPAPQQDASDGEGQAPAAPEELPEERRLALYDAVFPGPRAWGASEAERLAIYDRQAEVFRATGLVEQSWMNHFITVGCAIVATSWAPVAASCALGAGYWEAVGATWSACHLSTHATSTMTGGLGPMVIFLWVV